ncbi:MAG: amino acid adenylation domain-containing protein, partial [Gammaproteobacteria bacterium]|nr:amino acid adenylation domain-containing protein [Gammaproteobacteria bacterium]
MEVKLSNNNVLELVHRSVIAYPQAAALEHKDGFIDYQTLERHTNCVARQLVDAGLKKGEVVALFLTNPLDHIVALIGVLKAGGIFSPLDVRDPVSRLRKLAGVVTPAWWITDSQLVRTVGDIVSTNSCVLVFDQKITNLNGQAPEHLLLYFLEFLDDVKSPKIELAPDDPCYIFFTSGSSGEPKPILGQHKSLAHFIRWETNEFDLDERCRVSQLTSATFDAFLRDLFVPLACGGTLCLPPKPANQLSSDSLVSWLSDANITLTHTVPSLFRTLLQEELNEQHFPALQLILMAGEPVLPSDVQQWHQIFSDRVKLVNLYGSTETTLIKCFHPIKIEDVDRGFIPIGKPISDAKTILLDEQGQICPRGQVGELYLRSLYFTLGYYRQPERTAQVFVPNPLTDDPDDLVYRTGDLAIMQDDGTLRFLGRKDHQVKIRGVRVELQEVENALLQHADIHHAAVVRHVDEHEVSYLEAFYVSTIDISSEEIHTFLSELLPASIVPTIFTSLEEMPLTATGKIDRKALSATRTNSQAPASSYVAPSTSTQTELAKIWQEVLGVDSVGVNDNFFALGGHSLKALLTTSRIRKKFNVELPLATLFNAPTIAMLANDLESLSDSSSSSSPIQTIARHNEIPLSFAQQRLWFLDQLIPDNPFYNIPAAVRLYGQLDVRALFQSVNEVVKRHEVMRTVFQDVDGEARQIVFSKRTIKLPVVDLSDLSESTRETELLRLVSDEAQTPFRLSEGPLLRACLIHLDDDHHVALLNMHHIISDDWSMNILIQELTQFYDAFARGVNKKLSKLPIQYADFAYWQRTTLKVESLDQQMTYWREQLAGSPGKLELPTDHPRPAMQSYRGASYPIQLPAKLTNQLKQLSQVHNVTLFMTLMAAFQLLLSRYSSQQDISVGSPVANRQRAELESLIGFFVNTLVIRTQLSDCLKFTDILKQVRETTLGAYANQDLPFEQLVDGLQISRDLRYPPVFQVLLDLQNAPPPKLTSTGIQFEPLVVPNHTVKFDLELHLAEAEEGLKGRWVFASDLYSAPTIAHWSQSFIRLLEQLVEQPDIRLSELQWLSDCERQQVLDGPDATIATFPTDTTLHQRFEQQVLRS